MLTDLLEPCSRCGGEMGIMGVLGRRAHARCRGCGLEESEFVVDDSELEHLVACLADDEISGFWELEPQTNQEAYARATSGRPSWITRAMHRLT